MKLSFSTRGWSDLSFSKLLDIATEMRFDGTELYKLKESEQLFEKGAPIHKTEILATMRGLRDRGISIPVLDTAVELSDESCVGELTWYMETAYTTSSIPFTTFWKNPRRQVSRKVSLHSGLQKTESKTVCKNIRKLLKLTEKDHAAGIFPAAWSFPLYGIEVTALFKAMKHSPWSVVK